MKKRLMSILIGLTATLSTYAQEAIHSMRIHRSGADDITLPVNKIDSVTFSHDVIAETLIGVGNYSGEKVSLTKDEQNRCEVYQCEWNGQIDYHQAMAIYNDMLLTVVNKTDDSLSVKGKIFSMDRREYVQDITFPFEDYHLPHCNVCCFGRERATEDSPFPLLYLSQWDYESERGVLVYDIVEGEDGLYRAELKQKIRPEGIDPEIIGNGCTDWIVDTDGGYLYALAYYLAGSSRLVDGNKEMVVKFRLPTLSEGSEVLLTEADIIDHYELEMFNTSQDKTYCNGKIYILAGAGGKKDSNRNYLRVVDLRNRAMVTKINLEGVVPGEPEGVSIYQDNLLFTIASTSSYTSPRTPFRFAFY